MFDSQFIRMFLLVAIFAAVFLFLQVILRLTADNQLRLSAINKRLRMIAKGAAREDVMARLRKNDPTVDAEAHGLGAQMMRAFRRTLLMSSVSFTPSQVGLAMALLVVALSIVIGAMAWSVGYALTAGVLQMILAFSAAVAVAIPLLALNFLAQRRRKKMVEQFPVALDIFVRALRAGHPVASAIDLLTREMEDPIGSEFGLIADEVSYGAELTDALHTMADRWDMDDIRMFVVSLSVQTETGGNLAEILENLSNVIRARAAMYMKVRALSSEGRMTGWLLTALPIITFVLLFMSNPAFYLDVATDPIFYIGFPILIVWFLIGVGVIRNMVNLKV